MCSCISYGLPIWRCNSDAAAPLTSIQDAPPAASHKTITPLLLSRDRARTCEAVAAAAPLLAWQ